jgi:transposase-like protein
VLSSTHEATKPSAARNSTAGRNTPACNAPFPRTTNAIERLHEEFKRRIKTQTVLPSDETAAMLFWALLAAGQITMRKVDGWETLTQKLADKPIDLAA